MNEAAAVLAFTDYLATKEKELGEPLTMVPARPQRLSKGWAFGYQSRSYVETGDFSHRLVGHGPVVLSDEGIIVEGGSLDRDPEALLSRAAD